MDELISRQSTIDALEQGFKDVTNGLDKFSPTRGLIEAVTGIYKCYIEQLPPAGPKRGRWLYQIGMVKCDQCLRAIRRIDHDGLLNFCPNCGADMRGEQDD